MPKSKPMAGGFRARLEDNKRQASGGKCLISQYMERMDPEDAQALREAIDNEIEFSSIGLAQALTQHGLPISHSSVQRHRKGRCQCVPHDE